MAATDREYWEDLKATFGWTDEQVAQAKAEGKDSYNLLNELIGGDFERRKPPPPARTPAQVRAKAEKDAREDESARKWLRGSGDAAAGDMLDVEIEDALKASGGTAHELFQKKKAAKAEKSAREYLKEYEGWSDADIDRAMAQGGKTANEIFGNIVGNVHAGPNADDPFAERPVEYGGNRETQIDAQGLIIRPPVKKPGLPPGYKRNLELIDWLKEVTPEAKDLQYDAPTYSEEDIRLPTASQAGKAAADPIAKAAQYKALAGMRDELGNRGMGPEDILALTRISKQAEDSRLSGEQSRLRDLQGRGMTASGAQLAGGLAQGNRLRGAVQEARGDVLSQYSRRGQQAAQQLGQYGSQLGQQTFGERFERASAKDVFARANAKALNRRGEDIRGMSNRAEKQEAISQLQASGMRRAPAAGYLNFYRTESGARGQEAATAAAIDAENKRRDSSGPGFFDWVSGLGSLAAGVFTANPALIAGGGAKTLGNIEGATNKPKKIKKGETYSYGDD